MKAITMWKYRQARAMKSEGRHCLYTFHTAVYRVADALIPRALWRM